MALPLFPHTLAPCNFSSTQDEEEPFPASDSPEVRTLDGWLEQFFGSREDDYGILFTRLVRAVVDAAGCEIDEDTIQFVTADELDELTKGFSQELLCSTWFSSIMLTCAEQIA